MDADAVESWSGVAKALHWLVAVGILVQLPLGLAAKNWPLSPLKLDLFVLHKSIGLALLALVAIRIVWRLGHRAPRLPDTMSLREQRAAHASHALLYALAVAMPVTGWIASSAANVPFRMFWRIPVPAIAPADEALAEAAAFAHAIVAVLLVAAIAVHVAAALWHHYVRHDDVLQRMLPGRRSAL